MAAVPAEGFVRHFRHVRTAHHNGNAGGAHCIGHTIRLRDHSRHGADADEPDLIFADVPGDRFLVHSLGVAVNQKNLVTGRG
jgi:hypothetical protein